MLPEREFNALLVKWTPYVRFQVRKRCPVDLIEDAVQDVLLDACAKRENYDPNRGTFVSWLYWLTRARMQARFTYAKKRRHISHSVELHEDGEALTVPLSTEGNPHEALELREALDAVCRLKPRQADVVMQRAIGATFHEISSGFNCSKQYVEQLHVLGLKSLRKKTGRKAQETRRVA